VLLPSVAYFIGLTETVVGWMPAFAGMTLIRPSPIALQQAAGMIRDS